MLVYVFCLILTVCSTLYSYCVIRVSPNSRATVYMLQTRHAVGGIICCFGATITAIVLHGRLKRLVVSALFDFFADP